MSNKNNKHLPTYTTEKLYQELISFKKELFYLRFQKTLGELKDTSKFKFLRNKIAQVQTELNKRSLKLRDKNA